MRKKICYLFVFDGFADQAISLASRHDEYQLKTIAITKEPVRTKAGITILPDVDFIAAVDLDDIDNSNTAMLVLPGANAYIMPLIDHCLLNDIEIVPLASHPTPHISHLYAESYS